MPPTAMPEPMTLVYCMTADAVRLDPHDTNDTSTLARMANVFEPLYIVNDETGLPRPSLAESYDLSPDGKTYTFYLRQGVKFHDGTPFNADAVLWNMHRQWDPAHPYHAPEYSVLGFESWIDILLWGQKGDPDALIQDIVKVDDYTVRFVLSSPQPTFLLNLNVRTNSIVSPTAFEKWGTEAKMHPVGTGPFMFQEWEPDEQMILTRFPDYWNADNVFIDKLVFRTIKDPSALFLAMKAGECHGTDIISPDDALVAQKDPNLVVTMKPPVNLGYLGYNQKVPPLDDKNVRLALTHAIDLETIVDALYLGFGVAATQWMPPSFPGYQPDIKKPEFDLDKARELLKAAGLEDGFTIDLWYMPVVRPYIPDAKAVAEAIAASWAEIGVTANLKTEDWATYIDDWVAGRLSAFMIGTTPNYTDPNILDIFFSDAPVGEGASSTRLGYTSRALTDLLDRGRSEPDPATRLEIYREASLLLREDIPGMPIGHNSVLGLWSKRVQGYVPVAFNPDSFVGVKLLP